MRSLKTEKKCGYIRNTRIIQFMAGYTVNHGAAPPKSDVLNPKLRRVVCVCM